MSKTKPKKQLTEEQLRKLFLRPCKNKAEVKAWIKRFFGLELPDATVSRFADTNPFDLIYEIYEICVLQHNPQAISELLCVAGRGSGKTLSMAIVELMVMLHDKRDVVHVGAIQNQADRCYAYQKNFLLNPRLKNIVMPPNEPTDKWILEKANMSNSIFNVNGDKVTMEVLPCTLKACLTSDTLAYGQDGMKRLSDFKIGELIQSPHGWVEIIDTSLEERECIQVELDDGRVIIGTLDHKVWTNKGWIELQRLSDEHVIL